MKNKCVCVVVLGDVGRSPRMQYHSVSLAKEGYDVDVIGYGGSEPLNDLKQHPRVTIRYLAACPNFQEYCPRTLAYILKALWQSFTLLFMLFFKRRSHHILVQNPPALPALGICWWYCLLMSANYIIDWHNYGYSIMALSLGDKHKLVRIMKWFESYFGLKAKGNFCVTIAMKEDLKTKWNITAFTLYDRPAECFQTISVSERHELFKRLGQEYKVFKCESDPNRTCFTEETASGDVVLREDRPALLVSSTSWTEDEDFSILLSALEDYETARSKDPSAFPLLVCAITGKGPLKQHYCDLIEEKAWEHVKVITPWLQPEDYPRLLASADLGVCLHTSSSGLDLPMKIVDMFGCALPVLAYNYSCLSELLQHEENSYTFDDSEELSVQLQTWFRGFPHNKDQQKIDRKFRQELNKYQQLRWHENWKFNASPLFTAN